MDTQTSPNILYCSQCGQANEASTLARFGDALVCANCKNSYAQRLREGASMASPLAKPAAGFWVRVAAALIDGIILFVIQIIVAFAFAVVYTAGSGAITATILVYAFSLGGGALYEALAVYQYQATVGKMAMGLEVVRTDGSSLSLGRAFGRHFAKYISSITFGIGYLMVAFDDRKRGLHDMICDTQVVRSR
jgi:uncharacterized RDD family membrane protein YckC